MEFLSKMQTLFDESFELEQLYSLARNGVKSYLETILKEQGKQPSASLLFRIIMILLSNEALYDPMTLTSIDIACDLINYISEHFETEHI